MWWRSMLGRTSAMGLLGLVVVVGGAVANRCEGAEKIGTKVDKLIDVSLGDRTFEEAIANVSKKLTVPIRVDQDGLDDVGAAAREPFLVTYNQLTGGALLSLILEPRGLTWDIDGEELVVTSTQRMEWNRQTQLHSLTVLGPIGRDGKGLGDVLREMSTGIDGIVWEPVERIESSIEASAGKLTVAQHRAGHEVIADALRQIRRATSRRTVPLTQHEAADKYLATLLQKRGECHFEKTPLKDAVNTLAKGYHLPIWFDYASLSNGQKSSDQPVTLQRGNVPLSEMLDDLLHPLGLDWQMRDEVVYIATREDIDAKSSLQIYDATQLLMKTGGEAQLVKEIQEIDPDWSWGDAAGAVRVWNTLLFVRQTPSVHRRIASYLQSR